MTTEAGSKVKSNQVAQYIIWWLVKNTISPKNEYLYNHKELQEEMGLYDYGASRHNRRGQLLPKKAPALRKSFTASN